MDTLRSAFNERFLFVLWKWKGARGGKPKDKEFAEAVGRDASRVTAWMADDATAPPPEVVQAIAQETVVDPGWLTHGEESAAPEPSLFAAWLTEYRTHRPRRGKGKTAAQYNNELEEKSRKRGRGGA